MRTNTAALSALTLVTITAAAPLACNRMYVGPLLAALLILYSRV